MTQLDRILRQVEELSAEQQEMLIEIINHRYADARRAELAKSVAEAKALWNDGKLSPMPIASAIERLRELENDASQ